ncbi:hypothetical protein K7472_24890 [Streptomyces sp. PTM05]|uniref:Uncharacterized protein n=1 Tax=Streptantibioticus parmotrematis TaxID=2873249 RepID=A0ABS7QXV9_9ACTN|nr:hypothetical protein [Streptantibioticus parmotrematis]MBY8888052.1 hypothetical protein [Streptantibioticus parmotrematis]
MYLAIGDVVRVRTSAVLCTVSGIASHTSGNLVEVSNGAAAPRAIVAPKDLEFVARGSRPITTARAWASLLFLALAIAAAILNASTVHQHHVGWPMTTFVALTSVTAVSNGLNNLFNRPRRVRV